MADLGRRGEIIVPNADMAPPAETWLEVPWRELSGRKLDAAVHDFFETRKKLDGDTYASVMVARGLHKPTARHPANPTPEVVCPKCLQKFRFELGDPGVHVGWRRVQVRNGRCPASWEEAVRVGDDVAGEVGVRSVRVLTAAEREELREHPERRAQEADNWGAMYTQFCPTAECSFNQRIVTSAILLPDMVSQLQMQLGGWTSEVIQTATQVLFGQISSPQEMEAVGRRTQEVRKSMEEVRAALETALVDMHLVRMRHKTETEVEAARRERAEAVAAVQAAAAMLPREGRRDDTLLRERAAAVVSMWANRALPASRAWSKTQYATQSVLYLPVNGGVNILQQDWDHLADLEVSFCSQMAKAREKKKDKAPGKEKRRAAVDGAEAAGPGAGEADAPAAPAKKKKAKNPAVAGVVLPEVVVAAAPPAPEMDRDAAAAAAANAAVLPGLMIL